MASSSSMKLTWVGKKSIWYTFLIFPCVSLRGTEAMLVFWPGSHFWDNALVHWLMNWFNQNFWGTELVWFALPCGAGRTCGPIACMVAIRFLSFYPLPSYNNTSKNCCLIYRCRFFSQRITGYHVLMPVEHVWAVWLLISIFFSVNIFLEVTVVFLKKCLPCLVPKFVNRIIER